MDLVAFYMSFDLFSLSKCWVFEADFGGVLGFLGKALGMLCLLDSGVDGFREVLTTVLAVCF